MELLGETPNGLSASATLANGDSECQFYFANRRIEFQNAVSSGNDVLAEGVRFELTRPFGLPVFKTGAINRSATPPGRSLGRQFITSITSISPSEIARSKDGVLECWSVGVRI